MTELGDNIKRLRSDGLTYNQIRDELGCSKGTISYYLGEGQKEKYLDRQRRHRSTVEGALYNKTENFLDAQDREAMKKSQSTRSNPRLVSDKIGSFQTPFASRKRAERSFELQDVLEKYLENSVCYLTGETIDLSMANTYEFDHIVPKSKGGSNDLDNLGITTRDANRAKGSMNLEDFIDLCEKIARHHNRI